MLLDTYVGCNDSLMPAADSYYRHFSIVAHISPRKSVYILFSLCTKV